MSRLLGRRPELGPHIDLPASTEDTVRNGGLARALLSGRHRSGNGFRGEGNTSVSDAQALRTNHNRTPSL